MSNDTKKPVDPIFAHHSVVRERPQQESSATTAKKCSIEGCGQKTRRYRGMVAGQDWYGPYCSKHNNKYKEEWTFCDDCEEASWAKPEAGERCTKHGGEDYTPRTAADHPNPAPPEAKPCDDGKEENTPRTITEELISLGILPLVPLTPEEQAQDQAEWRARVRASIEEAQRQKAAEGEATK